MKCELCGNTTSGFHWKGIPSMENKIFCEECGMIQMKEQLKNNKLEDPEAQAKLELLLEELERKYLNK